jgi:O-antigen ligase
VIIPAVIFFALATVSNVINTGIPSTEQYLRLVTTNLTILILLPAVVDNERDVRTLALVTLGAGFISAAVAVMQHYASLGLPVYSLFPEALRPLRATGLAESPVHLSYQLSVILVPLFAIYFLKSVGSRARHLLILAALVILAGLYFTYTRSGMYALAPGLLATILLIRGKPKKELFLIVLILAAAFLYYIDTRNNRYASGFTDEGSAAARLVLWEAGIRVAMDNPVFGIGEKQFEETSQEYTSVVSPHYVEGENVAGILGTQEPHNDFIRVWCSFGTPALLAFLWMFVGIFRNFFDSYRHSSSRFLKSFALGCFAALATYVVSSVTHNVMASVALLWILGGLSIATTKLALARQSATVKELP